MADRIDASLFQRQCSLSSHERHHDDNDDDDTASSVVTILEVGGKRPVGECDKYCHEWDKMPDEPKETNKNNQRLPSHPVTHHCSGYNELRHYFDTQNQRQHDEVDPFFDEPQLWQPRSMKLL